MAAHRTFSPAALPAAGALAALLLTTSTRAEVTFDAATSGMATGASVVFDHTVGTAANRYLVVALSAATKNNASAVTYGGTPLTFLGARSTPDSFLGCHVELWGLVNPAPGSAPVAATFAGAVGVIVGGAVSHAGVDQTRPAGDFMGNDSWGAAVSLAATSAIGERLVDGVCANKPPRPPNASPDAAQTKRFQVVSSPLVLAGSDRAGAASSTLRWTLDQGNSSNWAIGAVSLRPAPLVQPLPDAGADTSMMGGGGAGGGSGVGQTGGAAIPADAAPVDDVPGGVIDAAGHEGGSAGAGPGAGGSSSPAPSDRGLADYAVGCACRTGGGASGPTPWLLAVAALGGFVRRGRQRPPRR